MINKSLGYVMKKFILTTLLLVTLSTSYALDMVLPIRGIADGDTIKTTLELPCPLCNVSVRILGIDTPESNHLAKCPAEQAKGIAAKKFLNDFISTAETMIVRNIKWDKYGGRIDGIVEIKGVNVGAMMISNGYARAYTGLGPKSDWCN